MTDRDKLEHWIVEHEQSGARPLVVWFKAGADDYRAREGYTVRGPFVTASDDEGQIAGLREALRKLEHLLSSPGSMTHSEVATEGLRIIRGALDGEAR